MRATAPILIYAVLMERVLIQNAGKNNESP